MNEVFVHMKVGNNETQFSMSNIDELQKIIIIQNMFEVMGVKNDISQMIDDYAKIGKAYHNFFNKVDSIESPSDNSLRLHNGTDYEQKQYSRSVLAKEYEKVLSEEEFDKELSKATPMHFKTGIIEKGKDSRYQCRLICDCGVHQTKYITKDEQTVKCSGCSKRHKVRWAKDGYLQQDRHNNFFIAGKFVGEDEF